MAARPPSTRPSTMGLFLRDRLRDEDRGIDHAVRHHVGTGVGKPRQCPGRPGAGFGIRSRALAASSEALCMASRIASEIDFSGSPSPAVLSAVLTFAMNAHSPAVFQRRVPSDRPPGPPDNPCDQPQTTMNPYGFSSGDLTHWPRKDRTSRSGMRPKPCLHAERELRERACFPTLPAAEMASRATRVPRLCGRAVLRSLPGLRRVGIWVFEVALAHAGLQLRGRRAVSVLQCCGCGLVRSSVRFDNSVTRGGVEVLATQVRPHSGQQ